MNYTKYVSALCILGLFLLVSSCEKNTGASAGPDSGSGKVVAAWNKIAYQTMGGKKNPHGLRGSRMYALVHIAIHDALNGVSPEFETYVFKGHVEGADPEVAAVAAAHRVLKINFPNRADFLDSALNEYLSTIPQNESRAKGLATGAAAADAVLAMGHDENGALDPIARPAPAVRQGDYKVVPPFDFIYAPFWQDSKLFSLSLKDQFRASPPPALNSSEYAVALNEVQELGSYHSKVRTADQSALAKYWYEESQDGWNRIARNVAAEQKSGLFATARLFALLNMAIADSYTAGWDSKLYYNFWRPFTAIRAADFDENELTIADKRWAPVEPTPPIQEYPSTHSALGNAGAAVLAHIFGDNTAFSMGSPTALPAGGSRSFNSFSEAANENARSRVMAGIHFRFSCVAGQELGDKIGKWTIEHYLRPL